jgi:hemolysin activation/secretion protein
MKRNRFVLFFALGITIQPVVANVQVAKAQSAVPPNLQLPPGTRDRVEEPSPIPKVTPTPAPAPIPSPIEFPTPVTPSLPPSGVTEKIQIQRIQVRGNTVLSPEIQALVNPYIGKLVTFDQVLQLRTQITDLYLKNGYISSGAFIPSNQDISKGDIVIQVVEGELEKVEIAGLRHLKEGYVRKRLVRATIAPLNKSALERSLQLLQVDPLIGQVNAELVAGSSPGRNILRLILKEAPAFHGGIAIDNDQSPSVGTFQGNVFINHDNLLGWGDRLSLDYGRTAGLDLYGVGYTVPLNAKDGTLSLRYSNSKSKIIEPPFDELGIRSKSQTLSIGLRQPLSRSVTNEFALGLGLDLRRSRTFILDDIPFSFSEGPEEGESKVTALRFSQDWVNRSSSRVLAARSQFTFGLDALGATSNEADVPDGRFFSWLGQFQWVQQLSPRVVLLTRLAAQITPDPLLSLERFSLGGSDTVRGYQQNQIVSDSGIFGSIESRIPLTAKPEVLQLRPFFDWGYGWNQVGENPTQQFISSVGLGVSSRPLPGLETRLDYGIPLVRDRETKEQRLHFSLRYQFF